MQLTLSRTLRIHALILIGVGGAIVAYRQMHVKPVQIEEMPEPTPEDMAEIARLTEAVRMSRYGHQGVDFVKSCRALIALQERYLVPEHPEILPNRETLVSYLKFWEKYAEAETECAVLLDILRRVMGADDPYTMQWQKTWENLHRQTTELAEKERMLRQTCKEHEEQLGAEHPDMLRHYSNLAHFLYSSWYHQNKPGNLQEALEFAKRAEALQIKSKEAGYSYAKDLREQIEAELKRQPVK